MADDIYTGDPEKDPSDILDYKTDFKPLTNASLESDWLLATEIINTFSVNSSIGINVHDGVTTYDGVIMPAPALADAQTSVVFWLSGGAMLKNYIITVNIKTSDSRKLSKSRVIQVMQR